MAVATIPREAERAWAAGFFDGEGTITRHNGPTRVGPYLAVKQATVAGEVPAVLVRFQSAVGVGRIGGPYVQRPTSRSYNPRQRAAFMWYVANGRDVRSVLSLLLPYLTGVKRAQATEWMKEEAAA